MSDLIRREDAIRILSERAESLHGEYGDLGGACSGAVRIIKSIPSAEPETAKVEKQKKVYESSNHMFAYETWGECGNCGEPVKQGANYCSWCGMKLDWSSDEM